MPYHYYVRAGGTATADAGRTALDTPRTGTFAAMGAAAYYDNIIDAMAATNAPVGGDIIHCASDHDNTYTAAVQYTSGPSTPMPLVIRSVDVDNCENMLEGAIERSHGSGDMDVKASISFWYMALEINSDLHFGTYTRVVFNKCELSGSAATAFYSTNTSTSIILNDTEITLDNGMNSDGFSGIKQMRGGRVLADGSWSNGLVAGHNSSGLFEGVECVGLTDYLVRAHATAVGFSRIHRCKIPTLTSILQSALGGDNQDILVTNTSDDSDEAEYQYFYEKGSRGYVQDQDDAGIHRAESQAYTSGAKTSLEIVASDSVNKYNPFFFDYDVFGDISASTKKIRIHFCVDDSVTLDDLDFGVVALFADAVDGNQYNFASSMPTLSSSWVQDPDGTATTHATDSGSDWRDGASALTGYNEYYLDVDTSGDPGRSGVVALQMITTIDTESTPIYVDPVPDVIS